MSTYSLRRSRKMLEEQKRKQQELEKQDEVFVCPHCDKEYKTQKGLDKHLEKHEDGE